jgi:methionyl-tRNA formyltransferase
MVKEMDAGDVLASKEAVILPDDTTKTLRTRLIEEGANLLADILPAFMDGTLAGVPQNHAQATFARKIEKSAGELDLAADARENWNKYRAYAENPGTYFFMERNGERVRVKIKSASFADGTFMPERVVPEGKKETEYKSLLET